MIYCTYFFLKSVVLEANQLAYLVQLIRIQVLVGILIVIFVALELTENTILERLQKENCWVSKGNYIIYGFQFVNCDVLLVGFYISYHYFLQIEDGLFYRNDGVTLLS